MKTSKSLMFLLVLVMAMALVVSGCQTQSKESTPASNNEAAKVATYQRPDGVNADQAKQLLVDGNQRYVSGGVLKKDLGQARRTDLLKGQKPFAVVLTCSDSRVPAELIFDQALGDLFIIRVAGNVIDPVTLGSIEYGVEHLGSPLIVIMGHSSCGAVKAAVDGGEAPGSIGSIVEKIKPSVEKAKASGAAGNALYQKSEDENILAAAADIKKSPIVSHLVEAGKVKIVNAKYDLGTGVVTFMP